MKNLLISIILILLISCHRNRLSDDYYCPRRGEVENIEGICEARFSKLYGDSVYLFENVSMNYDGHKYLISTFPIFDECPKIKKKYGQNSNKIDFRNAFPWSHTQIKADNPRLYTRDDSSYIYLIYGLKLQVLKVQKRDVPYFSPRRYFNGFMDMKGVNDSCFLIQIRFDSIYNVSPKYLKDSMFSKIILKRDFDYFSED